MLALELVLILLAVSAALQLIAGRLRIPLPALLVIGGGILAALPWVPHVEASPDVIFLIFVPPLLYNTAQSASWREIRARRAPILSLGVGLVIATTITVALATHAIIPDLTWASAFALGAIVAPPDPVAATAVLRPLGVSRTIDTILDGEGLANDATSLILYRAAVAAAISGTFSLPLTVIRIIVAGAGGIAIGLAIAWVVLWLIRHTTRIPVVENTLSLVIPFAVWIPADRLGASAVLAVVAAGIYLARVGPQSFTAATRIQHESMWSVLTFVLESLIFIFVGLELPVVIRGLGNYTATSVLLDIGVVTLVCIVTRLVWAFPSASYTRRNDRQQYNVWPEVLFIGWAGVRGADSLVIALALPLAIPGRPLIVVITFGVIVATLVVQGFTFGPAVRLLKLGGRGQSRDDQEEAKAWIAASDAALARLERFAKSPAARGPEAVEAVARLRDLYSRKQQYWTKGGRSIFGAGLRNEHQIARVLVQAARKALDKQRDHGDLDDAVVRHVERFFDLQLMLLDYPEWDIDGSPFEALTPPPTADGAEASDG
ncbi:MAG TPA: sodium:proton antiporter [Gemmatimonadaceae bacterium]|nr:sodium:proton antiporter [Gemmatimonadaceae bacterium]